MESCDELGLAASMFPESMLIIAEDTIGLKMSHDAAVNDVFQDLACHRCQRDWSIVTGLMFISFLEDGADVGFPPILRYCARIQLLLEYFCKCRCTSPTEVIDPLQLTYK